MTAFTGTQAQQIGKTVQNILMDYIRTKIQDANLTYRPLIGKDVYVTDSEEFASELYKNGSTGSPFILLQAGQWEAPLETRDGTYKYRIYEMTFPGDCTMSDHASEHTGPTKTLDSDRKLVDALHDIIAQGYRDLQALYVYECDISPDAEMQRAPNKRNPFNITCTVETQTAV